jgi:hypothetical protein
MHCYVGFTVCSKHIYGDSRYFGSIHIRVHLAACYNPWPELLKSVFLFASPETKVPGLTKRENWRSYSCSYLLNIRAYSNRTCTNVCLLPTRLSQVSRKPTSRAFSCLLCSTATLLFMSVAPTVQISEVLLLNRHHTSVCPAHDVSLETSLTRYHRIAYGV